MNRIGALLHLTRPGNVALAAMAVAVGAWTGPGGIGNWIPMAWAMVAAARIDAAGNTLNDVADVEVDRVNKPQRPLPSGRVTRRGASVWAAVLFTGGLAATIPLPGGCRAIAIAAVAGIVAYDLWWKGLPLIGNLAVAVISSFAFPFGSLAVAKWPWGFIPATLAFLFHLAREVIKDLEDMEADRSADLRTFPVLAGDRSATIVARGILILLVSALFVPWAAGWLGIGYLVIGVLGVGGPALYVVVRLRPGESTALYGHLSRALKWDMVIGLVAILVG